jgi:hypothetical protein
MTQVEKELANDSFLFCFVVFFPIWRCEVIVVITYYIPIDIWFAWSSQVFVLMLD